MGQSIPWGRFWEMLEKKVSASFCSLSLGTLLSSEESRDSGGVANSGVEKSVYAFSPEGLVTASTPDVFLVRTEILKPHQVDIHWLGKAG